MTAAALVDLATLALVGAGALFFFAGTVGLLRFPDTFTRLHALTKADNLGLGLTGLGLALQAASPAVALKILLVWLFALLASTVSCHLIAYYALTHRRNGPEEINLYSDNGVFTPPSAKGESYRLSPLEPPSVKYPPQGAGYKE